MTHKLSFVESELRLTDGAADWSGDDGVAIAIGLGSWYTLLKDSPLMDGERRSDRQVRRFRLSLERDFRKTILDYASLGDKLMRSVRRNPFTGKREAEYIPEFQRTPIFREYKAFVETLEPGLFSWLMMFCMWLKKIKLSDSALESNALDKWLATEAELKRLVIPRHLLSDLRIVMREILSGVDYRDFWPKHGPGAVAGSSETHSVIKHDLMDYDANLQDVFDLASRMQRSNDVRDLMVPSTHWYTRYASSERARIDYAEYLEVHKDLKGKRTICKEPVQNQFAQQGVLRCFLAAFERNVWTRSCLTLDDQSRNQRMAIRGSFDGSLGTLDLSDASDRNTWQLVSAIFPRDWVWLLDKTRSRSVKLPNGHFVETAKFAPMGSAVCFPALSATLLCITLLASVIHMTGIPLNVYLGRKRRLPAKIIRSKLRQLSQSTSEFAVYGDDIIAPNTVCDDVSVLLEACGFKVNSSKSFYGDSFARESCGVYALWGEDVTFPRFLIETHDGRASFQAGLCALHNTLDRRCLFYTKEFLSASLDLQMVTFVPDDSPFLRMPYFAVGDPRKNVGRVRYDAALQRYFIWKERTYIENLDAESAEECPELDKRCNVVKIVWDANHNFVRAIDLRSEDELRYRYGQQFASPASTIGGRTSLWGVERTLVVKRRRTPLHY